MFNCFTFRFNFCLYDLTLYLNSESEFMMYLTVIYTIQYLIGLLMLFFINVHSCVNKTSVFTAKLSLALILFFKKYALK